jgi:hypothetical protein
MSRRLRRVVLIVVALAVAAAAAALVFVQPDLDDARDRVDTLWVKKLRDPFAARYEALDNVAKALGDAGAADRAVTKALDAALARWKKLALRGPAHTDPGVEATTANELESLARRVRANVDASPRLRTPGVLAAMVAFDQTLAPAPAVTAYNVAVRRYEDARSGIIERIVAAVLGYDSRPALVIG